MFLCVRQCKSVKKLAAWYLSSIAAVRYMLDDAAGFDRLKEMAERRLMAIAKPLDDRCECEGLLEKLG